LLQERGAFGEARERYEHATNVVRRQGARTYLGYFVSAFGTLLHESGRLEEAVAKHEEAEALISAAGRVREIVMARVHLGAARAGLRRTAAAAETLARVESDRARNAVDEAAVRILRAHVHLARALDRDAGGDARGAAAHRRRAEECVTPDVDRAARRSGDVRCALRILRGAFAAAACSRHVRPFTIHAHGDWFEGREGKRVDLSRRRSLQRILARLVQNRREAPDESLSLEDIVAVGWPGERMLARSARARAHVSMCRLRKMGLRDVIVNRQGGYAIDPDVDIAVVGRERGAHARASVSDL
jgi:hypothetical protein